MPFGFEQRQAEYQLDNPDTHNNRQYIAVTAIMYIDGTIRPCSIE